MRYKILAIITLGIIFPFGVFAETGEIKCSPVGYSVLAINGIFTDENEAKKNKEELKKQMFPTFNAQPLAVDYLHNKSHLAGLGDIVMSAYQKFFEYETVKDYDLMEMIKDASDKVKTQKLLLVAHSQGNFYANSFYDTVAGKEGGVPAESIGVYSVATPAARVAGGGKWLTSDTDNVIAGFVAKIPFKKIMPLNTSIAEFANSKGLTAGHSFSEAYLKYRGGEIVSAISDTLEKLKTNTTQDSQKKCIDPPKLTLTHKAEGALLAVADPILSGGKTAVVKGFAVAYETGKEATLAVGKAVVAAGGFFAEPFVVKGEKNNSTGGPAAVVSAIAPVVVGAINQKKEEALSVLPQAEKLNDIKSALEKIQLEAVAIKEIEIEAEADVKTEIMTAHNSRQPATLTWEQPRILFVGMTYPGFGGGGSPAPIIEQMATVEQSEVQALSPPIAIAPQCDYSLALDGCLLATTTVVFSWQAVSGSDYYVIDKNGEYATTTSLFFSADIPDFSDYTFSVSAISSATTSATTTIQTVSVATVPIAINEIAWMGTTASSYDEWLELKNNTGHRINLSQWAIEAADNSPYIALSGEMSPYEYRVLERRENTITASAIVSFYGNGSSQWALGNGGEELTLYFASTTLDKTPSTISSAWTAGDNSASTSRKTMERLDSKQSGATTTNWATWGTNVDFIKSGSDADGNAIFGTPGECNSVSFININGGQNIATSATLESNNCYYISVDVKVSASSTLAIEEGARVSLYQDNLYIDGILKVTGEKDNPVIFDSFSGSPTNNYLEISGNNGTSTIDSATVSNTSGVYIDKGANVNISNADFINNEYGIWLNKNSVAVIENVSFASTTKESLSAYKGSSIFVASTTIRDTLDGDAIGIYDSNLSMSSTTIDTVYKGDAIGIYESSLSMSSTTIDTVYRGNGVYAYESIVSIASSTISNIYDGDGIGIYKSNLSTSSTTINTIYDGDGVEVYYSVASMDNSTISDVLDGDGLALYDSTTTISGVSVENVSGEGIGVYDSSVSGNAIIDGVETEF